VACGAILILALSFKLVSSFFQEPAASPFDFPQSPEDDVHHRNEKDADRTGADHTCEDRRSDTSSTDPSGTVSHNQRSKAENKRDRRHRYRAKAHASAENRCVLDTFPASRLFLGELYDQNAILRCSI
jgi:hypothetical protein